MNAPEDVIKVAVSLIERPLDWYDFTNSFGSRAYYECGCCKQNSTDKGVDTKPISHKLDCPILVARDLLSGTQFTLTFDFDYYKNII